MDPKFLSLQGRHSDIEIRVRGTLCFPPGSGGHFLLSKITRTTVSIDDRTNDHKAGDLLWLELEDLQDPYYLAGLDDALAELQRRATAWNEQLARNGHGGYAAMHYLPVITAALYDFHTDEMVQLYVGEDDLFFVRLCDWIKVHLKSNEQKDYKIADLLNASIGLDLTKVDIHDYRRSLARVEPLMNGLPLSSTIFGWMYYISCLARSLDAGDPQVLRMYVSQHILEFLAQPYRQSSTDTMIPGLHADVVRVIEWRELMLGGHPQHGMLSEIPRGDLNAYVRSNIALLSKLRGLLTEGLQQSIQSFETAAIARLDRW